MKQNLSVQRWFLLLTIICSCACSCVGTDNKRSRGLEQATERSGQGQSLDLGPENTFAIVFLHGWLMDTSLWDSQVEDLRGNYRCYVYAQPGHNAPGFEKPVTMTRYAETLKEELTSAGISKVVLVGHSMGGMHALQGHRIKSSSPDFLT